MQQPCCHELECFNIARTERVRSITAKGELIVDGLCHVRQVFTYDIVGMNFVEFHQIGHCLILFVPRALDNYLFQVRDRRVRVSVALVRWLDQIYESGTFL